MLKNPFSKPLFISKQKQNGCNVYGPLNLNIFVRIQVYYYCPIFVAKLSFKGPQSRLLNLIIEKNVISVHLW